MLFATWINVIGLERAKWLTDLADLSTWAVAVLLVAGGVVAWTTAGSATELTARNMIPGLSVNLVNLGSVRIGARLPGIERRGLFGL